MRKKLLSFLLALAMLLTAQEGSTLAGSVTSGNEIESTGAASPANPVHHCMKEDDGSDYTDWSYVYFGSYPQTEITGDDLTAAIFWADYDANGDAWVNGVKYRRISKSDVSYDEYFGESAYRYFKWESIKWRVLQNNGSTLFVVADQGLDCKDYNETNTSITWENCSLRIWLNRTFFNAAFSSSEQGAIVGQTVVNDDNPEYGTSGGNNTQDNVYLLSIEEVTTPEYGFCEDYSVYSASRWMQASDYAHAMGAYTETFSDYEGNCCWWLRSPGSNTGYAECVITDGYVYRYGNSVTMDVGAVAPALQINLSSDLWYTFDNGTSGEGGGSGTGSESEDKSLSITSNPADQSVKEGTSVTFHTTASGGTPSSYTYQWYYATTLSGTGTRINGATTSSYTIPSDSVSTALDGRYYYCTVSDGQYTVESGRAKLTVTGSGQNNPTNTPTNPVHHCTGEDDGSDDYTEWSYVYFGSYPQTEVTGDELTTAITGATYDANGDAWVNGTKYRRISKSDTNYDGYFGDSAYRYFKWEHIKWRVLENNGSTLFVVADQGLDCKDYNETSTSITWENCTLRTWLNETFYNTAFSSSEQGAIVQQTVINDDNPEYGTLGGNDTQDNVYLLSIAEVTNPEYGFCEDYSVNSASRWMQMSDYAHAMGAYTYSSSDTGGNANCGWWLRSPGYRTGFAAYVNDGGYVYKGGITVANDDDACVPALQIDLSSDLWHISDGGTSGEGGGSGTGSESEDSSLSITVNLADQTVEEGTSVTFQIEVSGGTPSGYTYQWYYATSQNGTGTRINGAVASSYTIPSGNVNAALNGRYYYCVVSNGQYIVESDRAKLTVTESGQNNPANPVYDANNDTTEWSYVYFGSYPQTEVTGDKLTTAITGASYDANGDAWVNGTKYRRASSSDVNNTEYFGGNTYRYFKWERIKWRVLQNNGRTLFVVADQGLDCKDYNETYTAITWENCTLRTWLNGTFYNTAFSSSEQGAIVRQTVVNDNNPFYGTSGGNNTQDNIYLLSIAEVTNPEYGFCEDGEVTSASRWMQASDYAHVMGAYTDISSGYEGKCWWWLRSPGDDAACAADVYPEGNILQYGLDVDIVDEAIVPALQINLSSALWYTSDDGTSGMGGGNTPATDNNNNNTNNGNASGNNTAQGNTSGNNSSTSGTGSSTSTNASVKLPAPKLTIKLSASNAIKLSWNKISGATGYTIYRATAKNGLYNKLKVTTGTSYTDKKLKKGTTYYYKIEAYNASAVSAKSVAVSRKILGKPAIPKQKLIKVNASGMKFTISWKKPKNATKIVIYRRVDNGKFKKWKTVAAKKTKASYSYKGYARGHRYSFQLRAYYKKDGVTVYSGYSNVYTIVM